MDKTQIALVWRVWDMAAAGVGLSGRELLAAKGDRRYSALRCLAIAMSLSVPGVTGMALVDLLNMSNGAIYNAKQDIPALLRHMPELYRLALLMEDELDLRLSQSIIKRRLHPRASLADAKLTPKQKERIDRIYEVAADNSGYSADLLKANEKGGNPGVLKRLSAARRICLALSVASLGQAALASTFYKTSVGEYLGFSERTVHRAVAEAPNIFAFMQIARDIRDAVSAKGLVPSLPDGWMEHP